MNSKTNRPSLIGKLASQHDILVRQAGQKRKWSCETEVCILFVDRWDAVVRTTHALLCFILPVHGRAFVRGQSCTVCSFILTRLLTHDLSHMVSPCNKQTNYQLDQMRMQRCRCVQYAWETGARS